MEQENYRCPTCGRVVDREPEHCPRCLCGRHEVDEDGYECGGTLQPISVWVQPDDRWQLILRCARCGELAEQPVEPGDEPLKLLSLASRPLANPPFPIEKLEEMTALMGGPGSMGGEDRES